MKSQLGRDQDRIIALVSSVASRFQVTRQAVTHGATPWDKCRTLGGEVHFSGGENISQRWL